jgi:hypothetical protein
MKKVKTSELSGQALDWAVARADGYPDEDISVDWNYSTDWAQGGPIIERENLSLLMCGWDEVDGALPVWQATSSSGREIIDGPTPLIAAMRCYVASKLGEEVDIVSNIEAHEIGDYK